MPKTVLHKRKTGFSFAEVLLAVAILLILFAIAVPNLIGMQKRLRQKELDAKAELIYIAAQNQLVKLRTSGNADAYAMTDQKLPDDPGDIVVAYDEDGGVISRDLHYMKKGNAQASAVMTDGTVSDELLGHSWIIEYEPSSCTVYAVFYSEKRSLETDYPANWDKYDKLRAKSARLDDGARVGYYGGDVSASVSDTSTLRPTITITNAETLSAHIQCNAGVGTNDLQFTLVLKDTAGNSYTRVYQTTELTRFGRSYSLDLVFDDLAAASTRFDALYGASSGHVDKLVPGTALTVEVTASSSNHLVEPGKVTATTNSLFADDSTDSEAHIRYARHLQNLDESAGVGSGITAALQMSDIAFTDDPENGKDWYDYYHGVYFNGMFGAGANFKPIDNPHLKTYDGDGKRIAGLNVFAQDGAGLFETISGGTTLKNIRLTGSYVYSTLGAAGALVGTVSGEGNRVENCGVYLLRADFQGKNETYVWISGENAGGLVGLMNGGSLAVTDSFAASVVDGAKYAGGLVGRVGAGTFTASTSFADCYLSGRTTAGLACGSISRMENCYAAGFQEAESTCAGFANGHIGQAVRCYTICVQKSAESTATYFGTAPTIDSANRVYYFAPSSEELLDLASTAAIGTMTSAELQEALGSAFRVNTADTIPYNLMGQSLTTYSYPRLVVNRHYGDWQADFETGALVYYEVYNDGTGGFYGANVVSTLKETGVVTGDGYGVVYKAGGAIPDKITVTIGGEETVLTLADHYTVRAEDGTEYHVYPLPKALVNAAPTTPVFYSRVAIAPVGTTDEPELYDFNPHFAKTVVRVTDPDDPLPTLSDGAAVAVRTPRHLYDMSLYYDTYYVEVTAGAVFTQERNIDYRLYNWSDFTVYGSSVTAQTPIGVSETSSFRAHFNGGCYQITDVSFITTNGRCIGLFGCNRGRVENVVIVTAFDPADPSTQFFVKRVNNMLTNETVSAGVLVGYNAGTVSNCAVAGYYVAGSDGTLHAYANSTLYVGGLVGLNAGSIRNSAADTPAIRLSSLYAEVRLGGFVGYNTPSGSVVDCYDIGYLEVAESRGGSVFASGFAGSNEGRIQSSYCATAITISGENAVSYGFAPRGGVVSEDCCYLDQGTYFFIDSLHSYHSTVSRTEGASRTFGEMRDLARSARADAKHTYVHYNTDNGKVQAYPFRASVRNADGARVHYGDWMNEPVLGTLGVFYWEYETGGSNDGYHLTYIGTVEGTAESGTTLCTSHDDGGRITAYGYGYYVQKGEEAQVKAQVSGLAFSGAPDGGPGTYNVVAADALHQQMSRYTFYPYTTRVASSGDYIYLDNGENRRGTLTLTFNGDEGIKTYRYGIAPFFANAMFRMGSVGGVNVTASDWRVTNYGEIPGTTANPYEVRCVDQLQYINWNYNTKNCTTLVYGEENKPNVGNFKQFPYLQYATVLTKGVQTRAAAEALRSPETWLQSHDLRGDENTILTPIAGMATSTPLSSGNYRDILYAWFGGSYDGQNYKIQNVSVISEAYSVGLFGAVAGADICNVVLFSDDGTSVIERNTEGKTAVSIADKTINFEKGPGAYFLGGLVGLAYEYKTGSTLTNKIENCAIAGYRVIDRSTNQQGAGTANTGGLIGLANINLENCSAVVDLIIDCTHAYGHMVWGSYHRIGGLAGSAGAPGGVVSVRNCYTGGSIRLTDRSLNETPIGLNTTTHLVPRSSNNSGNTYNAFVSGVIGGSYAPNISNFSDQESNAPDGTANIYNCYTYVTLPNLEGNIRAVSYFANQADRYGRTSNKINLNNCYYLGEVNSAITYDHDPDYFISGVNNGKRVINDEEFAGMLNGDLSYLHWMLNNQNQGLSTTNGTLNPVTYDELSDQSAMADSLNASASDSWSWVTVTEPSGANIDGKFSFSSRSAQTGKNYPFPTIITQKDNTFSTQANTVLVNVHYGAWPINGYYFENGRDTLDIFENMVLAADPLPAGGPYAERVFSLCYDKPMEEEPDFSFSPEGIVDLVGYEKDEVNNRYLVTFRALAAGSATVTENVSGASFVLTVSARLRLGSNVPAGLKLYRDVKAPVTLTAQNALPDPLPEGTERHDFSDSPYGVWTLEETDAESAALFEIVQSEGETGAFEVTCYEPGERILTAAYTYNYHGHSYSETLFIPVQTRGYVGVTDGTSSVGALRAPSGSVIGTEDLSALPVCPAGPELFLYATASDGDFDSFTVESIAVTPAGGERVTVYENREGFVNESPYTVILLSETVGTPDGAYRLRPVYVCYTGDEPSAPVTVTMVLTDPDSGAAYTLTSPAVAAARHTVYFDANGADGVMYADGTSDEPYTAPVCTFTRTGYRFSHWVIAGDDTETPYAAGDPVPVAGDLTLRAVWTANTYTVHFDANGADGEMEDVTATYGETFTLPGNGFTHPDRRYMFNLWNTNADGSGASYRAGGSVSNLTATDGAVITLYAQWSPAYTLTLMNGTDVFWTGVPDDNGVASLTAAPVREGWTFLGWTVSPDTAGVRLLDADGYITADSANVEGYTADGLFALVGNFTLYAKWSMTAYAPVTVWDADDQDGAYLVVSAAAAGAGKALASNGNNVSAADVTIVQGSAYNEAGENVSLFITDPPENAVFDAIFRKNETKNGKDYFYYSLTNRANGRFFRDNSATLQFTAELMYNGDYNNKHVFTYGVKYADTLQSKFQAVDDGFDRTLFWNASGNKWDGTQKGKTSALFKEQTLYAFFTEDTQG